jgi:YVTN family beta-propeller protein
MGTKYAIVGLSFCLCNCILSCNAQAPFGANYLKLEKIISLADVEGRIDHLAFDDTHQIVYVAALGNNSVEVIDLAGSKVVHSIKGLREPQGVEYLPFSHSIFVANEGTGVCNFFDATTFQLQASLDYGDDADDVRYLNSNKTVYVGYGNGGIGTITAHIPSRKGARTSLLIPSTHEFIVAVPRSNTESAELRVYKMGD